jgi:hypothetical protein
MPHRTINRTPPDGHRSSGTIRSARHTHCLHQQPIRPPHFTTPRGAALANPRNDRYATEMFHPLITFVRHQENASSMPEWVGFCLHAAALVASGWMVVATLSIGSWVGGLVGSAIFVPALFMTTGYLFPNNRR